MRTALRKMGNSTGMIVPKALLAEVGVSSGAAMEITVEHGRIVAAPVRHPREGWAEDAARIAAIPLTEEEQDWIDFVQDTDDEWTW